MPKLLSKHFKFSNFGFARISPEIENKRVFFEKLSFKKNKDLFIKDKKKQKRIRAIKVKHGKVHSICYIIDKKLAYISDVNEIYRKDFKYFNNLKYLIIDCLWYNYHPSHFNLETSLAIIKKLKPQNGILTNLSPVLDYKELKKKLPKNVIPAHDGLTIKL